MELIAVSPAGRQIIERYAASGFRVSGTVYPGPVLVFPDRTMLWPAAALTAESLAPVVEHGGVELLLLGLGRRMAPVAAGLRVGERAVDFVNHDRAWRRRQRDLTDARKRERSRFEDHDGVCRGNVASGSASTSSSLLQAALPFLP